MLSEFSFLDTLTLGFVNNCLFILVLEIGSYSVALARLEFSRKPRFA